MSNQEMILSSLLGTFEQRVEFDRAQIDLIKLVIKVARDLARVAGKSIWKQQPRQPLHPDQPVERRWRVDPAVGESRTEEHAAPPHRIDLRPRGIGSNVFGHRRIDGHDGIRLPADDLFQRDIVETSAWEAALDHIDGADAFDDLRVDRAPVAGLEPAGAAREVDAGPRLARDGRGDAIDVA